MYQSKVVAGPASTPEVERPASSGQSQPASAAPEAKASKVVAGTASTPEVERPGSPPQSPLPSAPPVAMALKAKPQPHGVSRMIGAEPTPEASAPRWDPTRRVFAIGALGGMLAAIIPAQSRAASSEAQVVLEKAQAVIEDAKHDPQFGNAPALLREARAVMVVPQLVKGGFFVGGEGGDGVLMPRTAGRAWGQPAFYVIGSASFGLQIGLEVAELVLFIMSDRALQALLKDEFKIGAQAGLTVLVVGSNAQAATTSNGHADIVAWAKSKGAYAGITLEGSVIKPHNEWNANYYGRPVTAPQIINGGVSASSASANGLRRSLQTS